MLALEGMMNAQRNRGMYLRVGERLAEIRKSRKISQAKLAKLLGVVEGTIQNYEHGRNEPNITRLYDAKRASRVECICRHSQQQIACLSVVPIGKQAQIRNVVVCHLSVGCCEPGLSADRRIEWATYGRTVQDRPGPRRLMPQSRRGLPSRRSPPEICHEHTFRSTPASLIG